MWSRRWILTVAALAGCSFDRAGLGAATDGPVPPAIDGPVADAPVNGAADADPLAPDAPPVDAPLADAAPPDAAPPDAAPPAAVGAPCETGTECGPGRICLDELYGWSPDGFCTMTCASDLDCGVGNVCSNPFPGAGLGFCFPDCMGGGTCTQPGLVCGQLLNGFFDLGEHMCHPGDVSSVDGDACDGFYDCDIDSFCANNPFENPEGYCVQIGCTVGNNATCTSGGDATCIAVDGVNYCIDTCGTDADCRVSDGYDCQTFWTPICTYPHQPTGAACTSDASCGEAPWDCLTGAAYPDGYCGAVGCDPANGNTCPDDAYCYDATPGSLDGTEWCAATCAASWQCRQDDGYTCQPSQTAGIDVCRQ